MPVLNRAGHGRAHNPVTQDSLPEMPELPILPRVVGLEDQSWPLHGAQGSRTVEACAARALPAHTLMQRAGLAVARLAAALAPHAGRIDVLAGPGNNGGDGWAAARELHLQGRAVRVLCSAHPQRLPADAAWARQAALDEGVPHGTLETLASPGATPPADLVVDALLGLGTTRPAEGGLAEAIAWVNACGHAVLAVDLPSGLDADTGQPLGPAVRATHTLAVLTLKPGLFTAQGRDHAGCVWFDALGVAPTAEAAVAMLPSRRDACDAWPARAHGTHKGSFGDVWVIGGARGMTGAAWLAAQAAAAAGAGRVYCSLLDDEAPAWPAGHPELMSKASAWTAPPESMRDVTVVAGCGGGTAIAAALPALLAHAGRLVLDADALNAIAAEPSLQDRLRARGARARPTVITPHPLEAARLLGCPVSQVQADRIAAAQELSSRLGCVAVLKGSGTVVASPAHLPSLNSTGNALLASPGSGDVLAGWMGGTWSTLVGRVDDAARAAAVASAWLHGHAADRALTAGRLLPLLAGELPGAMRQALAGAQSA